MVWCRARSSVVAKIWEQREAQAVGLARAQRQNQLNADVTEGHRALRRNKSITGRPRTHAIGQSLLDPYWTGLPGIE